MTLPLMSQQLSRRRFLIFWQVKEIFLKLVLAKVCHKSQTRRIVLPFCSNINQTFLPQEPSATSVIGDLSNVLALLIHESTDQTTHMRSGHTGSAHLMVFAIRAEGNDVYADPAVVHRAVCVGKPRHWQVVLLGNSSNGNGRAEISWVSMIIVMAMALLEMSILTRRQLDSCMIKN